MKFDVIIGNPPYQQDDGGHGTSAKPLYHLFVQQAKKLQPRYLSMIIPARWFSGGKGLDEFREQMLSDNRLQTIVDHFEASDVFHGIDISGGVCYFLWDRDSKGDCLIKTIRNGVESKMTRPLLESGTDIFIRFNEAISIYRKVKTHNEKSFADIVSSRKPFGLATNAKVKSSGSINVFAYPNKGYLELSDIPNNHETIGKFKVFISYAYGERGDFPYLVIGKPFVGEPNTACTETYITIGKFDDRKSAENVQGYMQTRFVRFLILLCKNTQHATQKVYQFVPMQDFTQEWTDEKLYAKYGLTKDEITFIESMVRPMTTGGANE